MKRSRVYLFAIVVLAAAVAVWAWAQNPATQDGGRDDNAVKQDRTDSQTSGAGSAPGEQASAQAAAKRNPIVTIQMQDGGEIKIELYPDVAPNTVNNFLHLARSGFYDGTIFHRVIPGFMIQGGDPEGTGRGGPGYTIAGEFTANGFRNDLKHERGVISMARTPDPNSAGSQFFIMVAAAPHLDGQYAAFGRVISGMDVVDRIVSVRRTTADRPIVDQRMAKVTVEQFGVEYPEPVKYSGR